MKFRRAAGGTAAVAVVAVVLIVSGVAVVFILSTSHSPPRTSSSAVTHEVVFQQTEACSSFWGVPWAVTIGNVTKSQPAGTSLPISSLQGTTDNNLAKIAFSLQNGAYHYTISPNGFFTPSSGSFTVSGKNVTVSIAYTGTSCTSTIGTSGSPLPISKVEAANVSIGGSPSIIAVDPSTNRVYVGDLFSDNLTVIDSATGGVVARVALPGNSGSGIAIDYITNTVYVLAGSAVAVVNGTTDRVVGELNYEFSSVAYDQGSHILYGSSGGSMLVGVDVLTGEAVLNLRLGYGANLAVDPLTHVVFAAGCAQATGMVCDSVVSAVNGTSGQVIDTVTLGNPDYTQLTMDTATDVAYVSGSAQVVALNGTTGSIIYNANSMACGPLASMAIDSSSNQLLAVSLDYNYIMVYDGATGALVNMYAFQGSPQSVAFGPGTNLGYATVGGQLIAFHNTATPGHFDSALTGSGQSCPLP